MSDYKEGFQDGYKFAREEIIEKLAEIDITDIDTWILDRLSDGHHFNKFKPSLDKIAYEVIELNKKEEAPQLVEMAD